MNALHSMISRDFTCVPTRPMTFRFIVLHLLTELVSKTKQDMITECDLFEGFSSLPPAGSESRGHF